MAEGVAARRYAQAIFEIAQERGEIDRWLSDLSLAAEVLKEPRVARFLINPDISFDKKRQVLSTSLGDLNPLALNLLYVLVRKGRIQALGDIQREYESLVNEWRGIEVAEVTTAVPLENEQADAVARRLEALTGKKIVLQRYVDPGIIGGLVAKVGDKLIDGSVRGKLAMLREQLG